MKAIDTEIPDARMIGVIVTISGRPGAESMESVLPNGNLAGAHLLNRLLVLDLKKRGLYVSGGIGGELNQASGEFMVNNLAAGLQAIRSELEASGFLGVSGILFWCPAEAIWRDYHGSFSPVFDRSLQLTASMSSQVTEKLSKLIGPESST